MFRIAICDGDNEFCAVLRTLIRSFEERLGMNIKIDAYDSGKELYEYLSEHDGYHLILVDAEMEDIYLDGRAEYAVELFRNTSLNFLSKPLNYGLLYLTICHAMESGQIYNTAFQFLEGKVLHRIQYKDVICFSSKGRKVEIHTNDRIFTTYGKLSDLHKTMSCKIFLRIHKSFIVNRFCVKMHQYDSVVLTNGSMLPISQPYRKEVRRELMNLGAISGAAVADRKKDDF